MAVQSPEKLGIKPPSGGFKTGGWYSGRQFWGGTLGDPGVIHPSSDQPGAGGAAYTAPKDVAYIKSEREKAGLSARPTAQDQVTPYLNQFQADLFKTQEAPKVKIPTMEELKKKLAPGVAYPDPLKRVEKFEEMRLEYGVADLEASLTSIKDQIEAEMNLLREQRGIEEGKPVPMGVIAGRISEEERVAQQRVDFLGRQQARITDELNTKYSLISTYMKLMGLDYTDAVTRYDTEFKNNIQMYGIILQQEQRALKAWEYQQTAAKANLQIYVNAITEGNLTYANMSTDQKLMVSKLEVQSGLPIGFVSNLRMSFKDRLLSVNDKTGEALMVDENGNFKVVQTGMRPTPTKPTEKETKKDDFAEMNEILQLLGGDDNIVSGSQWAEARSDWAQQGYSATEFDNAFRKYTNPDWDTYVGID